MACSREDIDSEEKNNCPICLCEFKIPRQLPCMHSFCEKCLQDYISSREETVKKLNKIECPMCRLAVSPAGLGKSSTMLASMFPINVIFQRQFQRLPSTAIKMSFRNCLIQIDKIIEITVNDRRQANYFGITYLYSGRLMLTDIWNNMLHLFDASYNAITRYDSNSSIVDVCVVGDNDEVGVTIPGLKTVQFLSVTNGKITPTKTITTRYKCYGIAAAGNGNIVISGYCNDERKLYWSLITSEGKETCHQIECQAMLSWTCVAVDSSFTRVYITVDKSHSLYCFDMSGSQNFVYRPDSLTNPRGVATDKYDNVYVVGYGSNNIHQLTPDGVVFQIISNGVPSKPQGICFNTDSDVFLVTNYSDARKLYQYVLK